MEFLRAQFVTPVGARLRGCRVLLAVVVIGAAVASGCGSNSAVTTSPTQAKCQVTLAAAFATIGSDGGMDTITVTTSPECPWDASTAATWLSELSPTSGQGTGTIQFRAAANLVPTQREGEIVVNDNRVRVSQQPAACRFALEPASLAVDAAGSTRELALSTTSGCSWTLAADVPWISFTTALTGNGDGTLGVRIATNATDAPRRGTVSVGDQRLAITQAGVPTTAECTYGVSPLNQSVAAADGPGLPVSVTVTTGCTWTATSTAPWLTVTAGASGAGNGVVAFNVAPNTAGVRTGTIAVANQTVSVTQSAAGIPPCTYTLGATTASIAAAGASGSVTLTAGSGCAWTTGSNASWITVTSAASASGPGAVAFSVATNTGAARTGTITIAGQTFTVSQAASPVPCTYALSAPGAASAAAGGSGTIGVSAGTGCAWSAGSNNSWITLTSGAGGSGNGAVAFSVAVNPGAARTGVITVAGQAFTVAQAAAVTCTYNINPTSGTVTALGGAGTFAVSAGSGCPWTAASTASWIAVTSGANGTGSSAVAFLAAPNPGSARTGTIAVAGQTFTVTQAALLCTYTLSSSNVTLPEKAGTSSVGVSANAGCAWTARSNETWITVTSGTSGTGNGTVAFSVTKNSVKNGRTGTVTIAGQVFTVTQKD